MLAGHDVEKRFALFRRGALVDDRLQLAVALMQCPGEMNGPRENQTIEFGLLEMSLGDPHADHALAITLRRQGIEVARAAKCAIAILDPFAFETPVGFSHGRPPRCVVDWTAAAWRCLPASNARSKRADRGQGIGATTMASCDLLSQRSKPTRFVS